MRLFRNEYGEWTGLAVVLTITLGALALVAVAMFVTVPLVAWFSAAACDTQWADFTHRWELLGGCLVEWEGRWYPADVVRTLVQP